MRYLKIISAVLASASALGFLVWIFAQNLVPSGVLVAHWEPNKPSALIRALVPESRLLPLAIASDGTAYQPLIAEPINFDMQLPSAFTTAKVTVKVGGDARLVELGGLASRETWTNDLRPAVNGIIDSLGGWVKLTGNGLSLYQRRQTFQSIDDFLANLPATGAASYRADVGSKIKLAGYVSSKSAKTYGTAFRGATTIKAYLADEKLDFSWKVQEVNRHIGPDGFTATAYLGDRRLASAVYADDGNEGADGKLSSLRTLHLYTDAPVSGVVRIVLSAGDDVVFRETTTSQQKFVFASRFYASDNVGYLAAPAAFSVMTNGRRLYATTTHPPAFQTLLAGASKLTVDDVNKPFTISLAEDIRRNGLAAITSSYGDLRLETAGLFAFGRDNFFNPDLQPITWETDVDADGIDYILTSYVPPPQTGEWRTASATFELNRLSVLNRSANFTISAPGIDIAQKELKIASVEVELRRPSLGWKDVWPTLLKWFRLATGQDKEFVNGLKN